MSKIMKKLLRTRLSRSQQGFTLVELLIVVVIIIALAAIIVPLVVQFAGQGEQGSANATLDTVQTAMDAAMADNQVQTVTDTTVSGAISDFSAAPAEVGGLALYLRDNPLPWEFCWDTAGNVAHPGGTTTGSPAGTGAGCP